MMSLSSSCSQTWQPFIIQETRDHKATRTNYGSLSLISAHDKAKQETRDKGQGDETRDMTDTRDTGMHTNRAGRIVERILSLFSQSDLHDEQNSQSQETTKSKSTPDHSRQDNEKTIGSYT